MRFPATIALLLTASIASATTIGENVQIKSFKWELGGFGQVLVIKSMSIVNANPIALKDLVVECDTAAPSGTTLSTVRKTVYQTFPAKKATTLSNINMGIVNTQSTKAGCEVIGGIPITN